MYGQSEQGSCGYDPAVEKQMKMEQATARECPKLPQVGGLANSANCSAPTPSEREIPSLVGSLERAQREVIGWAQALGEKLSPALRPPSPSAEAKECGQANYTEIGQALEEGIRKTRYAASLLSDLIDRLEL